MKILISGGSGLVGTSLIQKLKERGHEVNILVRKDKGNPNEFLWNIKTQQIDEKAFENIDTIIHLAGASIGKRWTKSYKKEIISSRIDSAKLLFETAKKMNIHLKSFISASGINYYGTFTSDKILSEKDGILHQDFLSEVCEKWENAAQQFDEISDRIVCMRTSPVLSKTGGSFQHLKKIADFNLASGIGSGKQWFNWIHLDDLVEIYIKSVEDITINGAYNAVADEIPTTKDFMKRLAKASGKLFIPINIPEFLVKIATGEMSEMVLEGTKISNEKIKSEGFQFKYPDLDGVLKDLV